MSDLTVALIKQYVEDGIKAFVGDPADDEFQRGFMAAFRSMYEDLFMTPEERRLTRQCAEDKVQ